MSYRVKDYNKNILAEFETEEELESYVSSSSVTSSLGEEGVLLNYFKYDTNIHQNLVTSGSYSDGDTSTVRITYLPEQDDIE